MEFSSRNVTPSQIRQFPTLLRPRFPPNISLRSLYVLPITLGHALQLILFLDRIAIAAAFGGVDQLLRQALGHALDVAKGRLTGADGEQRNGLVDTA